MAEFIVCREKRNRSPLRVQLRLQCRYGSRARCGEEMGNTYKGLQESPGHACDLLCAELNRSSPAIRIAESVSAVPYVVSMAVPPHENRESTNSLGSKGKRSPAFSPTPT
jgi:hypothetical protein